MKIQKDKIIAAFNDVLEGKRSRFAQVYFEDDKKEDKGEGKFPETKLPEPPETKPEKEDESGKDSQDKADDVLAKLDLQSLDNKAKVELISSVIDVLQDSVENDDEFSEYMNQILDIVNGYKFEKGEKEEEGGEEGKEKKPKKKEKEEKEPKEEKGGMEIDLGEEPPKE